MRTVIQRCSQCQVTVDDQIVGKMQQGLFILLGVGHDDSIEDIDYLIQKITKMRIWNDEVGKMNWSNEDINGDYLVVSQFTLMASTKKGNRPSFISAARPEEANTLYENFVDRLRQTVGQERVSTGSFGQHMDIDLINNGPVTIIMDSKNKQ